jgi:hypothetical protein
MCSLFLESPQALPGIEYSYATGLLSRGSCYWSFYGPCHLLHILLALRPSKRLATAKCLEGDKPPLCHNQYKNCVVFWFHRKLHYVP